MATLTLKGVTKIYDQKTILNQIDITVNDGEMMGLVGPSGCGKSTTLKMIAGIVEVDEGSIWLNEVDITHVAMEKRDVVVVFQDFLLFPHMTVKENISFGLKVRKLEKHIIEKKVTELTELVHLAGYENRYPHELSGGQKQRVAIARALAIDPKVILLDEPFSSLDIRLRHEMRKFIKEIHERTKATIILVTHDKEEAFSLCDRVGIMLGGEMVQCGKPTDVYLTPQTKQVAEFFGPVSYLSGEVKKGRLKTAIGLEEEINLSDGMYEWLIRPEDIVLDEEGIEAKVLKAQFLGERMLYEIEVKNHVFMIQTPSTSVYEKDDTIYIKINMKYIIK
ncbi:MAG: ABC transporter ATP-binding protein [Cellulosilyticaceae bacterium]